MGFEGAIARIEESVRRIDKYVMGNGQPGLEQRLVEKIDEGIEGEKREREKQHAANQMQLEKIEKKQDKQTIVIAMVGGALILLRFLVDAGWLRGWLMR